MLSGQGFKEVYNLKGGISAWQGVKAVGPVELNLDLIRGDETPGEMIVLAYGMEEALRRFYLYFSNRQAPGATLDLFRVLAGAEEKHQALLRETYLGLRPSPGEVDQLALTASSRILEGGFKFDEFVRENEPRLTSAPAVLELALMLETQALDLYLRFADREGQAATKGVLHRLADEENAHLAALGRLLDEQTP